MLKEKEHDQFKNFKWEDLLRENVCGFHAPLEI